MSWAYALVVFVLVVCVLVLAPIVRADRASRTAPELTRRAQRQRARARTRRLGIRGVVVVNTLERAGACALRGWAVYRKFTRCDSCAWQRYCGAARKRGPFLVRRLLRPASEAVSVEQQSLDPDVGTRSSLWSVTTLIKQGAGHERRHRQLGRDDDSRGGDRQRARLEVEARTRRARQRVKYLKETQRFASSNKAKDRGTDIHRAAEALALGESFTIDAELMPYVEHFRDWLDLHQPALPDGRSARLQHDVGLRGTCDGLLDAAVDAGRDVHLRHEDDRARPGRAHAERQAEVAPAVPRGRAAALRVRSS
jgi:hypothetical protein